MKELIYIYIYIYIFHMRIPPSIILVVIHPKIIEHAQQQCCFINQEETASFGCIFPTYFP